VNTSDIFPNPVKQGEPLQLLNIQNAVRIDVFDASGKLTFRMDLSNNQSALIPTSSLEVGLYLLRIHGKGGLVESRKIVVN
jgi:hypothetical protein